MGVAIQFGRSGYVARKDRGRPKVEIVAPTPEQMAGGAFAIEDITDKRPGGGSITIGKGYRRKRMLETLFAQGVLAEDQFKALKHYRHHADIADRSPVKDSLGKRIGGDGSGCGPTVNTLNAIAVTRDCEAAAMGLKRMLRAVVVDDMSLSQWAIERAGGIEECYERKGKKVCQIKPRRHTLAVARMHIIEVARRVQSELDQ